MWWYLQCIGLVLALFAPALPACAQGDMTIQFRPVNVRNLAGVVTGASGKGFQGAVVEDCDSTYKRVLASTTTDANGRFSFAHAKYGALPQCAVSEFSIDTHSCHAPVLCKGRAAHSSHSRYLILRGAR
jgi:hypothetical protein